MELLKKYLIENQDLLNLSGIEKAANIPNRTLFQVIKGDREIPIRHLSNLIEVLIKMGGGVFQIGHFTFKTVSEYQEFEAYSITEISEPIEVNDEQGNTIYFKYPAFLSRDIITDDVDLITYLK